ncbi:MAG TPA: OmpA family protein [Phycisphaerae bacterium]|nr:OmpA family protein [Phycisphaerae bacterium]
MHVRQATRVITIVILILGAGRTAAAADKPGCKDHPLFPTRMPGYSIADCVTKEFDRYEFFTVKPPKHAEEGRFTFITYRVDDRQNEPSAVAVVRNYENAIKKAGGTIVESVPTWWVNGKIVADGREIWVQAEKGNGLIWLRIIEKEAMEQYITADAAAFGKDINTTGHAAVYGVYFDTGKSELKPESEPALKEVAALLAGDPTLKLWVVGHTDAVGQVTDNMTLSQARAEAVVHALVTTHGIATARLKAYGVGPLAPVASNASEEGRAKNRRVELVRQ